MSLDDEGKAHLDALAAANVAFMRAYPGERPARQPVHTFYGGAHLFKADTIPRLGELALRSLDAYAPDPATLAAGVGMASASTLGDGDLAALFDRVRAKLQREPIEDFRIDFEDGFGARPDAEEDAVAESSAREVANALAGGRAVAVHRHSHQVVR